MASVTSSSMNEANDRDPFNNNSFGTLVDDGYKQISLPILDVNDFNERIIRAYEDGTAEKSLPADLTVARCGDLVRQSDGRQDTADLRQVANARTPFRVWRVIAVVSVVEDQRRDAADRKHCAARFIQIAAQNVDYLDRRARVISHSMTLPRRPWRRKQQGESV